MTEPYIYICMYIYSVWDIFVCIYTYVCIYLYICIYMRDLNPYILNPYNQIFFQAPTVPPIYLK